MLICSLQIYDYKHIKTNFNAFHFGNFMMNNIGIVVENKYLDKNCPENIFYAIFGNNWSANTPSTD